MRMDAPQKQLAWETECLCEAGRSHGTKRQEPGIASPNCARSRLFVLWVFFSSVNMFWGPVIRTCFIMWDYKHKHSLPKMELQDFPQEHALISSEFGT